MTKPSQASSQPEDDPRIPNEELLYRGLLEAWIVEAGKRVSTAAFKGRGAENISVDRASLTTPKESLGRLPLSVALGQVLTGSVRQLTPGVASAPSKMNPAHALIIRDRSLMRSAWSQKAEKLAEACEPTLLWRDQE